LKKFSTFSRPPKLLLLPSLPFTAAAPPTLGRFATIFKKHVRFAAYLGLLSDVTAGTLGFAAKNFELFSQYRYLAKNRAIRVLLYY